MGQITWVIEGPFYSVIPLLPKGYYTTLSKFIDDIVSYIYVFTSSYRDTLGKCLELLSRRVRLKHRSRGLLPYPPNFRSYA